MKHFSNRPRSLRQFITLDRRSMLNGLLLAFVISMCGPASLLAQRPKRDAPAPKFDKQEITKGINKWSSPNFQMVCDLDDEEAQELLTRLETMLTNVSGYFGRKLPKSIDMYVAKKIENWPSDVLSQMDRSGIASIERGAGVTQGQRRESQGRVIDSEAVVYAVADHGTPQHESVHAYCVLAFGRTGPVWFSEGMAEVGNYWKGGDDKTVSTPDYVIDFIKKTEAKPLNEIVNNPLETTGDSWSNYTWRWAICHLLGFNENYSPRFRPLGLALLAGENVDFWKVYGGQEDEIQFEYEFFLKHITQGYRVDLCSWDWKTKPLAPRKTGTLSKISAARGWQATRVKVEAGTEYLVTATGNWRIDSDGAELTADGNEKGAGRLVGIIMQDYKLSEEFELGQEATFTPTSTGALFVRCRDDWGAIGDNKGIISIKVKEAE